MSEQPEVEIIARLLGLAARYGLEELEAEEGGLRINLKADPIVDGEFSDAMRGEAYLWHPPRMPTFPEAAGRSETAHAVLAPLTGIFYRAADPSSPPFAEVGATVEEGQTIGIIEAMKVFSEVKADRSGVVLEVVAPNGKQVSRDDVLLYLEPSDSTASD